MSLINEPRGRAREYAALALNVYTGCDHGCVYCYSPNVIRVKRDDFRIPKLRKGFLDKLEREAARLVTDERVLLSFACDPYQRFDVIHQITRQAIEILHAHGIAVQILTKGGSRALRDLDLFRERDAFATTLTLLSPDHSRKWEPGAALPLDRIDTIRQFHQADIPTWVSLEPVLNPDSALELVRCTHEFVDLYKVGKLNYHPLTKRIDWRDFAHRITTLLDSLGKPYLIKDDLKKFLL